MIRKSVDTFSARLHPLNYTIVPKEKAMEKAKKCLIFRAVSLCGALDEAGTM